MNQQQRPGGLDCPECNTFIPIGIDDLLSSDGFICRCCGLVLTINRQASDAALKSLRQVHDAQENVRRSEQFSR